jgi:hypothetical protein
MQSLTPKTPPPRSYAGVELSEALGGLNIMGKGSGGDGSGGKDGGGVGAAAGAAAAGAAAALAKTASGRPGGESLLLQPKHPAAFMSSPPCQPSSRYNRRRSHNHTANPHTTTLNPSAEKLKAFLASRATTDIKLLPVVRGALRDTTTAVRRGRFGLGVVGFAAWAARWATYASDVRQLRVVRASVAAAGAGGADGGSVSDAEDPEEGAARRRAAA